MFNLPNNVDYSAEFKRDFKRVVRRGENTALLFAIVDQLARNEKLAFRYRDHLLTGDYAGFRECHVEPDFLLIYFRDGDELTLSRVGSHSDLY